MTPARFDFDELVATLAGAEDVDSALSRIFPAGRRRHAAGAASLAASLAERYGYPDAAALRRGGLLHDAGRALKVEARRSLADWRGWPPDDAELRGGDGLLHGPAGAAVAAALGLSADVCSAIRYHVTGRPGATLADKIVMAADAAEPNRPYSWADAARAALGESLDLAVAFWIHLKVGFVKAEGGVVHSRAAATWASLDDALKREAERLARPYL